MPITANAAAGGSAALTAPAADADAATAAAADKVDYSVIIPTYNEAQNVPILTALLLRELRALSGDGGSTAARCELVFVDDASPDGTADIIRRLQVLSVCALFSVV